MNKNKIRKAAYKAISKERKGHQEFFDTFRKENKVKHGFCRIKLKPNDFCRF